MLGWRGYTRRSISNATFIDLFLFYFMYSIMDFIFLCFYPGRSIRNYLSPRADIDLMGAYLALGEGRASLQLLPHTPSH